MTCTSVIVHQSAIKPDMVCKEKSSSFPWLWLEKHSAHYLSDTTSFIQSTLSAKKTLSGWSCKKNDEAQ
jgi:hypothetical protein